MPSPFPGMDPYLEQSDVWPDFHARFIANMADELGHSVRPRYFVRIEEQIYLHELGEDQRRFFGRSDIAVQSDPIPNTNSSNGSAILAEPLPTTTWMVETAIDELRTTSLEIVDRQDRSVVTAIELLSPSNKAPGADRTQYLRKVRKILASSTGFVEIDLLRGGPRMPWKEVPPGDYCVVSSAAARRPEADCWSFRLRDPLPKVTVPLREGEADVRLDLKSILDRTYDSAGYELSIYTGTPTPPLVPEDEAWAKSLLASAGLPA